MNLLDPVREPGVPAELPSAGDDFFSEEVPWLLRVCAAYARVDLGARHARRSTRAGPRRPGEEVQEDSRASA